MKIEMHVTFEGTTKDVEFLNKMEVPIQIIPEVKPSEDKSEEE